MFRNDVCTEVTRWMNGLSFTFFSLLCSFLPLSLLSCTPISFSHPLYLLHSFSRLLNDVMKAYRLQSFLNCIKITPPSHPSTILCTAYGHVTSYVGVATIYIIGEGDRQYIEAEQEGLLWRRNHR